MNSLAKINIILTIAILLVGCQPQKPLQLNLTTNKSEKTANLLVPNNIILSELDGKNIDNPYTNKPIVYRVDAGNHELTAKFYCMWRSNNGDNVLLKSKKVKLSSNFEENKTYRISHAPLTDFDKALELEKNPVFFITLVTPDNSTVNETTSNQSQPPNRRSLDAMKLIWETATEQEKKEFLEWAQKK